LAGEDGLSWTDEAGDRRSRARGERINKVESVAAGGARESMWQCDVALIFDRLFSGWAGELRLPYFGGHPVTWRSLLFLA
jgi:hypothetical protein